MHGVLQTPCMSNAIAPFRVGSMVRFCADPGPTHAHGAEGGLERGVDRILKLGPDTAFADIVGALDLMLDVRAVDNFKV